MPGGGYGELRIKIPRPKALHKHRNQIITMYVQTYGSLHFLSHSSNSIDLTK